MGPRILEKITQLFIFLSIFCFVVFFMQSFMQYSIESEQSTTNTTSSICTTVTQNTTSNQTVTTSTTTNTTMIDKYIINVDNILQNPELPTGCEVTSATILLNYYRFSVDKMEMYELLLRSSEVYWNEGKLVVPNPNKFFMGDPKSTSGYGLQCFAPVIETTLNTYLEKQNSSYVAKDISGYDLEDLFFYVRNNIPVIVWASIGMVQPYINETWIDSEGNKVITYKNIHCLVLTGYDDNYVYVCDPLGTLDKVKIDLFESRYDFIGKQSVIMIDS